MRLIVRLLALALLTAAASANAADRIVANGFEPCCTLGGEVTGLAGNGLVLHLAAGAMTEDKPVIANGSQLRLYTFTGTVPTGTTYAVSITSQPSGQNCTLSNASGTMANAPVENINAICVVGPANLVWDDGSWDDANWQ